MSIVSSIRKFLVIIIFFALLVLNILKVYDIVVSRESSVCAKLGCWWTGISVCYDWNGGRCFYPYTVVQ